MGVRVRVKDGKSKARQCNASYLVPKQVNLASGAHAKGVDWNIGLLSWESPVRLG